MYSDERNRCSHQLGFPIRKSPDHRLLASSRGLSQLTTSFIASLRQGIHTHALSSLTIKSISNTKYSDVHSSCAASPPAAQTTTTFGKLQILVVSIARQIFDCQRSDFFGTAVRRRRKSAFRLGRSPSVSSVYDCSPSSRSKTMVGLDRLELSTSPLSGVRSSHLSYRPDSLRLHCNWWSWSGSNRRPPECKSGALPAELQPQKN